MNKYQEALDKISSWSKRWANTRLHGEEYINDLHNEINCEKDTLQELVDKATPKKPITIGTLGGKTNVGECQSCGSPSVKGRDNYCYECGQALDWSKE